MQPAPTLRRLRRSHSAILVRLAPGEASVTEGSPTLSRFNLRAISKPLKVSERAGPDRAAARGAMAACQPSADWMEPLFATLGGELGSLGTTICADTHLYLELSVKENESSLLNGWSPEGAFNV